MDLGDSCCLARLQWRRKLWIKRAQVDIIKHQQVELLQDLFSICFGSTFELSLYVKELQCKGRQRLMCRSKLFSYSGQPTLHVHFESSLRCAAGQWEHTVADVSIFWHREHASTQSHAANIALGHTSLFFHFFRFGSPRCYAEASVGRQ